MDFKNRQKGSLVLAGLLVGLTAAAIAAGVYWYQTQTKTQIPAQNQNVSAPNQNPADLTNQKNEPAPIGTGKEKDLSASPETETPPAEKVTSPAAVPPEADTAGWQTYRNEKYGFEFKYPAGYLPEKSDKGIFFSSGVDCKDNSFCAEVEGGMSPSVHCYAVAEILQGLTFENYLSERNAKDFPIKKIVANGDYGYEIEEAGMAGAYKSIYFLNGDNLIEFSVAKEGNERGLALIDQMISTFKFIDVAE